MIIVAGTITMDPDKVADATDAIEAVMAATQAEEGNLSYVFAEVLGSPGTIQLFEQWADQAALDSHFAEPHMAEFMKVSGDFGITGTDILKYEAGEGSKLM